MRCSGACGGEGVVLWLEVGGARCVRLRREGTGGLRGGWGMCGMCDRGGKIILMRGGVWTIDWRRRGLGVSGRAGLLMEVVLEESWEGL